MIQVRRALLFLSLLALASPAWAATYYVNKAGSNGNSCPTAQSPTDANAKLTVAAGVACLSGGDTLIIGDGTYVEQLGAGDGGGPQAIPSGSAGFPTIIQAENRNLAILRPTDGSKFYTIEILDRSYITIDGIVADNGGGIQSYPYLAHGTNLTNTHHIIFKNGIARNGQGDFSTGIALGDPSSKVHDCQILDMEIYNNGLPSFLGLGIGGGMIDCVISGNRIHDNGNYGIEVYRNATGNQVYGNTIYNHANRPAFVLAMVESPTTGTINNSFYNNIGYNNAGGFDITGSASITGNFLYSNTFTAGVTNGGFGYCFDLESGSSNTIRNNICYGNTNGDTIFENGGTATKSNNILGTNPLFSNPSGHDYTLTATSPAIGFGATLGSPYNVDFTGATRTAPYDAGAYKYGGSTPPPVLPPTSSDSVFRSAVLR